MIYILIGAIITLVGSLGVALYQRNTARKELATEKLNLEVANEDVKILKYNYSSLKKVYTGMLKKQTALKKVYASTLKKHNVLDVKLKKIQKTQNYRKK
jgi:hypothetical protein